MSSVKPGRPDEGELSPLQVVEYEQHGRPYLALTLRSERSKYRLLNEAGEEFELHRDRLFAFPLVCKKEVTSTPDRLAFLKKFQTEGAACLAQVDLETLYELSPNGEELTIEALTELMFPKAGANEQFALRRALLENRTYFKRTKLGYEKRTPESIEELKRQEQVEAEKAAKKELLIQAVCDRLNGSERELPAEVSRLEQVAALGSQGSDGKENVLILEEILNRAKLSLSGKSEAKAFELLVRIRHFSPVEDLNLHRLSRPIRFSQRVMDTAVELSRVSFEALQAGREDFRQLFLVTIDSESTRDVDDALSCEKTAEGFRLGIHISDVASIILPDSVLDRDALRRATSIYSPDYQVPMLPPVLSEGALSLLRGEVRPAMSYIIDLSPTFEVRHEKIVRSLVKVSERLSYDQVDAILYSEAQGGETETLVRQLWDIACAYEMRRINRGALHFSRRELNARIDPEGGIRLEETDEDAPGRKLVGELMIVSNELSARHASSRGVPLIYRGQDPAHEGRGIDKIPEGPAKEFAMRGLLQRSVQTTRARAHSSLGVPAYAQVTSPIRRASDLVNQRQLAFAIGASSISYSEEEVRAKLEALERIVDEVNGVQRARNRFWLMKYIEQEKLTEIEGTIVRVDGVRPLVELDVVRLLSSFSSEKSNLRDPARLGERIRLRIVKNDPQGEQLFLSEIL